MTQNPITETIFFTLATPTPAEVGENYHIPQIPQAKRRSLQYFLELSQGIWGQSQPSLAKSVITGLLIHAQAERSSASFQKHSATLSIMTMNSP
jgi:hypothetical protein